MKNQIQLLDVVALTEDLIERINLQSEGSKAKGIR